VDATSAKRVAVTMPPTADNSGRRHNQEVNKHAAKSDATVWPTREGAADDENMLD
jgi:hypothetical protein